MLISIFSRILCISITSAVLVIVICLAKSLFREKLSSKWHYYIWILLAVRLLIPCTPEYNVNTGKFFSSEHKHFSSIHKASTPEINTDHTDAEKPAINDLFNEEESYKDMSQLKTTVPHTKKKAIPLWAIASVIWLFGVVLFSLYFIGINTIAGKKLGEKAVDINNNKVGDILDHCKRLSGIKCDIPVVFQRHIKTPAIYGVLKPKLLIPVDLLERLDREDLKYVILHELCHYKRKDTLTGFIMIFINAIYWFNPFIWYAFIRIKEDRELLIDQMVLSFVQKHERRTYALTLVKILEISSEKYRLHNAVGIIEGRVSNMEHRIKLINMFKKKSLIIGIETGLFIAVISVVLMIFINNSVGLPQYTGSKTVVSKVKNQTDRGVFFDRNGIVLVKRISANKSLYPYKSLASHVVGYTGKDNMGLFGVEKLMDDRGLSGDNAVLTIDKRIQEITEKSLENAMKKYHHNCGTAIVIDTSTGEILAMSSKPDFDLNSPFAKPKDINSNEWSRMTEAQKTQRIAALYQKNRAISEAFIPGASFKAITAAMGLDKMVIKPDTQVNDSPVKIQGNIIRCWRTQKLHGKETFTNAVCNSCNPVFANLALKVGAKGFSDYMNGFGLCSVSKLGLKGEVSSVFKNKPAQYDISLASIGQGIKVTPLQLVMAYGAIANEGKLLEPHIIKEVKASDGKTVNKYEPRVVRNTISKQTSDILKGILVQCVSRGTAGNAYIKGYNIGGMTGTGLRTEGNKQVYIPSFAGFASLNNHSIACVVVFEDSGKTPYGHMGGMTAAPDGGRLLKDTMDYLNRK